MLQHLPEDTPSLHLAGVLFLIGAALCLVGALARMVL